MTGIFMQDTRAWTLYALVSQMIKNEIPAYEIISGAAIAFGALLLIIPGFATDLLDF